MSESGVIPLDCRDREQVMAVTELHKRLLSDSLVPQLGHEFMARFYYPKLVEAGLIKCDLYKYEGRYIAFSAYTKYPFSFMEEARRMYLFRLCCLLLKMLLVDPRRVRTIFKIMRLAREREDKGDRTGTGEMLSFGVLEEYGHLKDERTGLRISNLLFERALSYFLKEGFTTMRGEIALWNKPSLLLWHSYGGTLEKCDSCQKDNHLVIIKLGPLKSILTD